MKIAITALTLAALAFAPMAHAADGKLVDCIKLGKQVSSALDTAQPGTSTEAARTMAASGRTYCASAMYAQGVASYSRALQLLGKG
jgi:hypothetical protein